jgi:hypothetical protein
VGAVHTMLGLLRAEGPALRPGAVVDLLRRALLRAGVSGARRLGSRSCLPDKKCQQTICKL